MTKWNSLDYAGNYFLEVYPSLKLPKKKPTKKHQNKIKLLFKGKTTFSVDVSDGHVS